MTFANDLESHTSDTAIITEDGRSHTYQELTELSDRITNNLVPRSLVLVVVSNTLESVAGYLGFLRAKIVPALVNDSIPFDFLQKLITRYEPRYLFLPKSKVIPDLKTSLLGTFGDYQLLKTNFQCGYKIHPDLALLLSTSGSTGSPKFVRLSYENIQSNAQSIAASLEITKIDRPITTLPMSYTYGLSILNSHLALGATIVLTQRSLLEKGFWQLMTDHHVTTFGGVPYTYEILKKLRFADMNLPSLKYLTQAGGKLNPEAVAEWIALCEHKKIKFIVMYGQTEATARMSVLPWSFAKRKPESIGQAIPGGKFWLENEVGKPLDANHHLGELVYQGSNVSLGYAEGFADLAKEDENHGVLHTGDLAKKDDDGFYYIVGRKSRFLKLFGLRINLQEVEQLLFAQGYDSACVGDDQHLRIYIANLQDHATIKQFLHEKLGLHVSCFSLHHIDKIPRSDAGKILYALLQ